MPKPYSEIRNKIPAERRRRNEEAARDMLLDIDLQELRKRLSPLTQEQVAAILDVTQAQVSKYERSGDMLISRLRAYVEALGGELVIEAVFPNERVTIRNFSSPEADLVRSP